MDRLVQRDALRSIDEAADLGRRPETDSETLTWLREQLMTSTDPDLLAILAGLVWDVAQILLFRAGDIGWPDELVMNPRLRETTATVMREAQEACARALELDWTIESRSPFVPYAARLARIRTEAPGFVGHFDGSPEPSDGSAVAVSAVPYYSPHGIRYQRGLDASHFYADVGLAMVLRGGSYLGVGIGYDVRFGAVVGRVDRNEDYHAALLGMGVTTTGVRMQEPRPGFDQAATLLSVPFDIGWIWATRYKGVHVGATYSPSLFVRLSRQLAPVRSHRLRRLRRIPRALAPSERTPRPHEARRRRGARGRADRGRVGFLGGLSPGAHLVLREHAVLHAPARAVRVETVRRKATGPVGRDRKGRSSTGA